MLESSFVLPNSPPIQKRVVAGGSHGKTVEAEECEEVVGPAVEQHPHVLHQVQDVDGQPADDEDEEHQEQDKTSLSISAFCSFFLGATISH